MANAWASTVCLQSGTHHRQSILLGDETGVLGLVLTHESQRWVGAQRGAGGHLLEVLDHLSGRGHGQHVVVMEEDLELSALVLRARLSRAQSLLVF